MQSACFNTEEIALLTAVLDRVCTDQQVLDQGERTSIGKRIILKAQTGERRFQALADYAARGGLIPQLLPARKNGGHNPTPYRFSVIDPAADKNAWG